MTRWNWTRWEGNVMNMQEAIQTTSWFKTLYLTQVRGLRIRATYCTPVAVLFTHIVYSRAWVLVPA